MNTKRLLILVNMIIIVSCVGQSNASLIDQQQPGPRNYGFWFEKDIIRWQEFSPTMPMLDAVEFNVTRWGNPGDISVQISDSLNNTLYSTIIPESSIAGCSAYGCINDWIWVDVPGIAVTVDALYRLKITALNESASVDNRYFWNGVTNSEYARGISSVENSWPDYDFCFKTYAVPEPATLWMFGLGPLVCLKKRLIRGPQKNERN